MSLPMSSLVLPGWITFAPLIVEIAISGPSDPTVFQLKYMDIIINCKYN